MLLTLITSLGLSLQIQSQWELGLQHMNLEVTHNSLAPQPGRRTWLSLSSHRFSLASLTFILLLTLSSMQSSASHSMEVDREPSQPSRTSSPPLGSDVQTLYPGSSTKKQMWTQLLSPPFVV